MKIVGIHGIGNYRYLVETGSPAEAAAEISADWARALGTNLSEYNPGRASQPELRAAYYAHHLHRGTVQGDDDPAFLEDTAQELFIAWIQQLVPAPVPQIAQGPRTARARAAADWLAHHFGKKANRIALAFCREVSTYLSHPARRQAVRDTVAATISQHRPTIVIGHSLGTVVAYETLWQHPELKVDLMLTLGSPLAIPGVIFERLEPTPVSGRGARPPAVASWANLADVGDIIAIPRTGLRNRFDQVDTDKPAIVIGEHAFHGAEHYLACFETAEILAPYLERGGHPWTSA